VARNHDHGSDEEWLDNRLENDPFVTTVTEVEIWVGITFMPDGAI